MGIAGKRRLNRYLSALCAAPLDLGVIVFLLVQSRYVVSCTVLGCARRLEENLKALKCCEFCQARHAYVGQQFGTTQDSTIYAG